MFFGSASIKYQRIGGAKENVMIKVAATLLNCAVGIRPSNNNDVVQSLFREGDAFARGNQWSQALEKYNLLLQHDQTSEWAINALFNGAIAKHNLNRFEEAINDYDRLIRETRGFLRARSFENRAAARCILARKEDTAPAFSDFAQAISLYIDTESQYSGSMLDMNRDALRRTMRLRGIFSVQQFLFHNRMNQVFLF